MVPILKRTFTSEEDYFQMIKQHIIGLDAVLLKSVKAFIRTDSQTSVANHSHRPKLCKSR